MIKITSSLLIFLLVCIVNILNAEVIYDFSSKNKLKGWNIVDDNVMGGWSRGSLRLDSKGNGVFSGYISLKNYGGFSSIRYRSKRVDINEFEYIVLKIFGDNNYYQLRIKSSYYDRHVYVKQFYAKDEWQEVKIRIKSMQPQFRGRRLNMRNFDDNSFVELGILIGNKVEEDFSLLIDHILLK